MKGWHGEILSLYSYNSDKACHLLFNYLRVKSWGFVLEACELCSSCVSGR